MAAALRYASRRLGGCALQRLQSTYTASASTPAIVQVVAQRRLLQTVAKPPTGNITVLPGAKCATGPTKELAQIETKKEELFGLISELDSKLPAHCTRVNRHLAIDLSAQVEPKPNNPKWRWYRRMQRMNNCLFYGGLTYMSSMSVYYGFQVPSQ